MNKILKYVLGLGVIVLVLLLLATFFFWNKNQDTAYENETVNQQANQTDKVYLYYDIDDPTRTYIYENGTYVEYYFNATTNTYWRKDG